MHLYPNQEINSLCFAKASRLTEGLTSVKQRLTIQNDSQIAPSYLLCGSTELRGKGEGIAAVSSWHSSAPAWEIFTSLPWAQEQQELGLPHPRDSPPCSLAWWCPGSRGRKVPACSFIPAGPTLDMLPGFQVSSFCRTFQYPQARGIRMHKVLVLQTNSSLPPTVLVDFYTWFRFFWSAMISRCWRKMFNSWGNFN